MNTFPKHPEKSPEFEAFVPELDQTEDLPREGDLGVDSVDERGNQPTQATESQPSYQSIINPEQPAKKSLIKDLLGLEIKDAPTLEEQQAILSALMKKSGTLHPSELSAAVDEIKKNN
jgi:hypothetical protein